MLRRLGPVLFVVAACSQSPPPETSKPAPPARAEHPIFSLWDNRLLAHVEHGGDLVVLPGSPGFAKYLDFEADGASWTMHREHDGRPVGLAKPGARLRVPMTQAGNLATLRLHAAAPDNLQLLVNNHDSAPTALTPGWQTVGLDVVLEPGENEIEIRSRTILEIEFIYFSGDSKTTLSAPPATIDADRHFLRIGSGDSLAYYLYIAPGTHLVADAQGCPVAVAARAADGASALGSLAGPGGRVDLSALAGRVARVELSAGCSEALLAHAALTLPGAAGEARRAPPPRHVVLWIMDSLRADKLRAFSPSARPESAAFTALAGRGTRFTAAYVQGNESRASHASIWTSLYPVNHGMVREGARLDSKWVTIGEALHDAGLFTSGSTANGYVSARWGFTAGWDVFYNAIHQDGSTRGEDVLAGGLASVEAAIKQRFFLYIGTVDTHVSWRGKEPWLSRYDPGPYHGRYQTIAAGGEVDKMSAGALKVSDRDQQRIIALYDSNVSYQDALLARLVAQLDTWGVAGETMLVVTADHGDELWEDGRVGHGGSLRETLVHVPLLVVYPPLFPAGTTVDDAVEAVDILPTILEALGRPVPDQAQGASLIPLAQGAACGYPRPAFSSQFEEAYVLRLGGWKLAAPGGALFDLSKDPREKQDVAGARPIERRWLTDALATFLAYQGRWKQTRWGVASNASPLFADDLER